jgi:hypothetical protein
MNHVIIIDNSYSMTQKTSSRLSFLEIAKKFAETYILMRMNLPETKGDKFFVFNTDRDNKKDLGNFVVIHDAMYILESLRSITPSL